LVGVTQQLAISAGVAVGAFAVEATMAANHSVELRAGDFWPAFLIVAVLSALSAYSFWKLPEDAGHEISGHRAPVEETPQAAEAAAAEQTHDARDQKLG
ncbi:MAG TPA: MFS transporter, partial [Afipia sp.]|nr:MFS transporter [Afipia sp.]